MWTATTKREAALRRPHAGGRGGGNSDWKAYHSGFACGGQVSESKRCLLLKLIGFSALERAVRRTPRCRPFGCVALVCLCITPLHPFCSPKSGTGCESGPCHVSGMCPESSAPMPRQVVLFASRPPRALP